MKKLIALGSCFGAPGHFAHLFSECLEIPNYDVMAAKAELSKITKDSVVMFGGGEDISPSLYSVRASKWNGGSERPSRRDAIEVLAFERAQAVGAAVYGICRGAQLVCALSGGTLYQDVTGHAGSNHLIRTNEDEEYVTSSVHHQMMNPGNVKHELIAWTPNHRSRHYVVTDDNILNRVDVEPEIVFFPKTYSLGVQGHPEFMAIDAPFVHYNSQLIKEYLL